MNKTEEQTAPVLKVSDKLAIERTKLANERTFLAYFRTFVVMLSSGFAILKIEFLQDLKFLGIAFLIVAPLLLLVGVVRYYFVKRKIDRMHFGGHG